MEIIDKFRSFSTLKISPGVCNTQNMHGNMHSSCCMSCSGLRIQCSSSFVASDSGVDFAQRLQFGFRAPTIQGRGRPTNLGIHLFALRGLGSAGVVYIEMPPVSS